MRFILENRARNSDDGVPVIESPLSLPLLPLELMRSQTFQIHGIENP